MYINFPIETFFLTSAADLTSASVTLFLCISSHLSWLSPVSDTDLVFFHAESVIFTQPERVTASSEHC